MTPSHHIRETDDKIILSADWWPQLKWGLYSVLVMFFFSADYIGKVRANSPGQGNEILIGMVSVFGVGLLVAGTLLQYFGRDDIVFDLRARKILWKHGLGSIPLTRSVSFDALKGVVFEKTVDTYPDPYGLPKIEGGWKVSVEIAGEKAPLLLIKTSNEGDAFSEWEHFAKTLGIPAVDKTGPTARRISSSDLDRPLREILASEAPASRELPSLPAGSAVRVEGKPGRFRIMLVAKNPPQSGELESDPALMLGTMLLGSLGGIVLVVAVEFALAPLYGLDVFSAQTLFESLFFAVIGVLFIALAIEMPLRSWFEKNHGCATIIENDRMLSFCKTILAPRHLPFLRAAPGQPFDSTTIKKSDIKSIGAMGRPEIAIHLDGETIRLGRGLSQADLDWLYQALLILIR